MLKLEWYRSLWKLGSGDGRYSDVKGENDTQRVVEKRIQLADEAPQA